METIQISESVLETFATAILEKLDVPLEVAKLAARSMLDASLMGIDTHGIEVLGMYVTHLEKGGLKAKSEPILVKKKGSVELWDMHHGFGLASARKLMFHAINQAHKHGICLVTCRNTNHIGACGIYGKIAADEGLIGIVSQQTLASLPPWGGKERRVGASPFAFVAPVKDSFPFYFDASMGAVTRGQIKAYMRAGKKLPEGVALDSDGNPTTDPKEAWHGQIMPIGKYKGIGLAMVFEILQCVLSGNIFSLDIPSIIDNPERSADTSLFMIVIDPEAILPHDDFPKRMKSYIDYIESSPARDSENSPCYPGRREGENWLNRRKNGIPVKREVFDRFNQIAQSLGIEGMPR